MFPVLLVDDGELDDIRDLLNAERIDFAHLRGGAVPKPLDAPSDLFVTNARRAILAGPWQVGSSGGRSRPICVAVVEEDSNSLRETLRDLGFSYLIRRPIHPVALRLLLLQALYHGEERRSEPRVPIGYEVRIRSRLRRRDAWLADLSRGGCSILADRPMNGGASISVHLPPELDEGESELILSGKVLRSTRLARSHGGQYQVAVRFQELGPLELERLETALSAAILDQKAPTPEANAPLFDEALPTLEALDAQALDSQELDRRNEPRARYSKRVIASVRDAMHRILIGRDLSATGMRIEAHDDLRLEDRLRVAIYDASRATPLVVEAIVDRDDGPNGLHLRFEGLDEAVSRQLEELVASLPPVECLSDGELGAMGTVVSEILLDTDDE